MDGTDDFSLKVSGEDLFGLSETSDGKEAAQEGVFEIDVLQCDADRVAARPALLLALENAPVVQALFHQRVVASGLLLLLLLFCACLCLSQRRPTLGETAKKNSKKTKRKTQKKLEDGGRRVGRRLCLGWEARKAGWLCQLRRLTVSTSA